MVNMLSIESEPVYNHTLDYIAEQAGALAKAVTGRELPLDTLTIFAQNKSEYQFIEQLLRQHGPESPLSHEPTLYIDTDLQVRGNRIKLLGVRKPDPSRQQRGYGDYPVTDLGLLRKELTANKHVQPITSGNGIELLELRHPDYDVLGYIVEIER